MSTQPTWPIDWYECTEDGKVLWRMARSIGPLAPDHNHWAGWHITGEESEIQLAATAPDLLAALEDIGSRPCFSVLLGEDTSTCGCPSCTARAVIAKAEEAD